MGIEKSKKRQARETLYWPKMGDDIYDMISKCSTCQRHRYKQQQDTIQPHERPENPWVKVGWDLFYFNNRHYVLVYIKAGFSPFSDRVGLPPHNTPFPGVLMKSIGAAFCYDRMPFLTSTTCVGCNIK